MEATYQQTRQWENPQRHIIMRLYSTHDHQHRLMVYQDDVLAFQKYYTNRDSEMQSDVAGIRTLLECREETYGQRL